MSALSTFGFESNIENVPKLVEDLEKEFGLDSVEVIKIDNSLTLQFDHDLSQAEIDLMNSILNNFIEQDAAEIKKQDVANISRLGFDLYLKIIGDIQNNGGLPGATLDNDRIPKYKELSNIRMMLKDGLPEYAMREFVNIQANNPFNTVQSERYLDWMQDLAYKRSIVYEEIGEGKLYPTKTHWDQTMSALRTAPMGDL